MPLGAVRQGGVNLPRPVTPGRGDPQATCRDDVVAPDLRHLVRVRRAAQVLQQR
jgi:hypothetical protein